MENYVAGPQQASRTIKSNPQASRQAPLQEILQQYISSFSSWREQADDSSCLPDESGPGVTQQTSAGKEEKSQPSGSEKVTEAHGISKTCMEKGLTYTPIQKKTNGAGNSDAAHNRAPLHLIRPVEHGIIQGVWEAEPNLQRIKDSAGKPASEIIQENIQVQQSAFDEDGGKAMRESGLFTASGYEFEFAQLPEAARGSEFAKKSHMRLAQGPPFPLYPEIPVSLETDMASVIELAMPPLLIPRIDRKIDKQWLKTVMLKIETGLKALARNGTSNLSALVTAISTFLRLGNLELLPLQDATLQTDRDNAQYGFMQKNSNLPGRYSTAQANVVTSLAEAIELAYGTNALPAEIQLIKIELEKQVTNLVPTDTNNYRIFMAQKLSEIPYIFFDSLYSQSLTELAQSPTLPTESLPDEDSTLKEKESIFNILRRVVGYGGASSERQQLHNRQPQETDHTLHSARTTVSKVKDRSYGWIKSTLGQQLMLFPPELIRAGLELTTSHREDIRTILRQTVAYKTLVFYASVPFGEGLIAKYEEFENLALNYYQELLDKQMQIHTSSEEDKATKTEDLQTTLHGEAMRVNHTKEQIDNPQERHLISSARPDTVVILNQDDVAYQISPDDSAVLVEIRETTPVLDISTKESTTNVATRTTDTASRARQELILFNDTHWVAAYSMANPGNAERIDKEKHILELLSNNRYDAAYAETETLLGGEDPGDHPYWKKWFGWD